MLDWLIRGATVVDGSGCPGRVADIGVTSGRIVAIGAVEDSTRHMVDADHLVLAPGFIDIHSHDDGVMLGPEPYTAKLCQGVTTVLGGNCGLSLAPAPDRRRLEFMTGLLGSATWDGPSYADYLNALDKRRPLLNIAGLVGHCTVRASVMGLDSRPPTDQEMRAMQDWVQEAMDAGAFGLSTGLIYPPNCFSTTDEIVELATVAGKAGGFYATHIRDEADGTFDAVREAITIGERAQLPVQISHLKLTGRKNWGGSARYLRIMAEARARGLDVMGDVYPYDAGSTELRVLLPPWAHQGGIPGLLGRLHDPDMRARLRRDLTEGIPNWWNPFLAVSVDKILLTTTPGLPEWQGQTLSAIAASRGTDPIDTLFDVLGATNAQTMMVIFAFGEEDVRAFMRDPFVMFGTDGIPTGPLPHPRTYGTFARVLGHYVREDKVLDLPEAIRKMTALPAQRLNLTDRGMIRLGAAADLVLLDPEKIRDRATYLDPQQQPEGIHSVWVNGVLAWQAGQPTGATAGCVLRHPSKNPSRESRNS